MAKNVIEKAVVSFHKLISKQQKTIDPTVHSSAPYISILGFFQLPFYIEEPSYQNETALNTTTAVFSMIILAGQRISSKKYHG